MLINTRHIFIVNAYKGKYQIKLNSEYPDMKGFWVCGSGMLKSETMEVTIDKKEDPKDYQIVTEWIQQQ